VVLFKGSNNDPESKENLPEVSYKPHWRGAAAQIHARRFSSKAEEAKPVDSVEESIAHLCSCCV